MALVREYDYRLRRLLDAVDNLRVFFFDVMKDDITKNLFSIIVVGNQSVGKSSLLEAISGVPLPKGAGRTVTRSPISIQLRSSDGPDDKITFMYRDPFSGRRREEVVRVMTTEAVTDAYNRILEVIAPTRANDENITVTKETVTMKVERQGLPSLTLVDLPGLITQDGARKETIIDVVRMHVQEGRNFVLKVKKAFDDESMLPEALFDGTENRLLTVENFMGGVHEAGTVTRFNEINRGKTNPALHGVRLRAADEMRVSVEDMDRIERDCYKGIVAKDHGEALSEEDKRLFLKSCGVRRLVEILAEIQAKWIMDSKLLKNLQCSVELQLQKDKERLEAIENRATDHITLLKGWNEHLMLKYQDLVNGEMAFYSSGGDLMRIHDRFQQLTRVFSDEVTKTMAFHLEREEYYNSDKFNKMAVGGHLGNLFDEPAIFAEIFHPVIEEMKAPADALVNSTKKVVLDAVKMLLRGQGNHKAFKWTGYGEYPRLLEAAEKCAENYMESQAGIALKDVEGLINRQYAHLTLSPKYEMATRGIRFKWDGTEPEEVLREKVKGMLKVTSKALLLGLQMGSSGMLGNPLGIGSGPGPDSDELLHFISAGITQSLLSMTSSKEKKLKDPKIAASSSRGEETRTEDLSLSQSSLTHSQTLAPEEARRMEEDLESARAAYQQVRDRLSIVTVQEKTPQMEELLDKLADDGREKKDTLEKLINMERGRMRHRRPYSVFAESMKLSKVKSGPVLDPMKERIRQSMMLYGEIVIEAFVDQVARGVFFYVLTKFQSFGADQFGSRLKEEGLKILLEDGAVASAVTEEEKVEALFQPNAERIKQELDGIEMRRINGKIFLEEVEKYIATYRS